MPKRNRVLAGVVPVFAFFVLYAISWQVLGHPDLLVAAGLLILQAIFVAWYFKISAKKMTRT